MPLRHALGWLLVGSGLWLSVFINSYTGIGLMICGGLTVWRRA